MEGEISAGGKTCWDVHKPTRSQSDDCRYHHDDSCSRDVKEKLDRIAIETQRSKSFLAGEAVAAYVDRAGRGMAALNT